MAKERSEKNINWLHSLQNPRSYVLKKYIFDILKDKYFKYDNLVERISSQLVTEIDVQQFAEMMTEFYALGYRLAIEQQREELGKLGIKVNINIANEESERIFNQKNQDVDQKA